MDLRLLTPAYFYLNIVKSFDFMFQLSKNKSLPENNICSTVAQKMIAVIEYP